MSDSAPQTIRILIADDHALMRSGLRMLLEAQSDLEVTGDVASTDDALSKIAELRPDVLLLDLSMPGSNAIDAIGRVRGLSPRTKVLVLTMHDNPSLVRSAIAAGAAGYMVKTGADTELVTAIRRVHRGRSYIDVALEDSALQDLLDERRRRESSGSAPARDLLSGRERQVLQLVAFGHTNKEVAERLGISIKSVATYRSRLSEKLGFSSRADLVRYALQQGILDDTPSSSDG
jgi:two-component system response regulator NreC